ncbi:MULTISPECIES: hypothetical protein [Nocardiaceae]|uniref:Uncharacterized protein n=1 Tax=Rhodococcoides yunnanense TaxID=278209 RepID=A0ABU4B8T9_9NOCA|nr:MULTISPECIES: hypothetical protein [Rhodococcus]MDI9893659.1 hypothetical protein [Rhodococcus sp. IEGM 1381]MDV6260608.1 hypothetical protein [Rhodococcus yunnanensis]
MSTLSQSVPSRVPSTASIVVLAVGCLIALPLKYAGTAYFVELSTGSVTVDEVTQANVLLAVGDTVPLFALAVFVVLQPVSAVRRALGVLALAAMILLDFTTVLGALTLGLEDPLLFGGVMATILMATSSWAWILARRRSLLTLILIPVTAAMGFFFHYSMFASLIYSPNVAPIAAQIISQLLLLLSVVAVVWLAVGMDALVSSPTTPPVTPSNNQQPVGYTSDGRPVFDYKPNSR